MEGAQSRCDLTFDSAARELDHDPVDGPELLDISA
jgi:hypothetical protein